MYFVTYLRDISVLLDCPHTPVILKVDVCIYNYIYIDVNLYYNVTVTVLQEMIN